MLYVSFIGELEKIAKARAGSTLEIKTDPYGLGMHSKREGKAAKGSYRPLAYTQGLPTAAVAGLAGGALTGPLTEGRMLNIITPKGRKKIKSMAEKDFAKLQEKLTKATKMKYLLGGKAAVLQAIGQVAAGKPLPKQEQQILKNLGSVLKRRLTRVAPGALRAAGFAAGTKALYNIGSFEQGRLLTPSISNSNRKRK